MTLILIDIDIDTMVPYDCFSLKNSIAVSATKELLSHQDETRVSYNPITAKQLQYQVYHVSPEILQALLHKSLPISDLKLFMSLIIVWDTRFL